MLHINDVTLRLGSRLIFDHATAALPERGRVGFVGRNGAGKTTLFRIIAGDQAADSGTVSLPKQLRIGRVEQEAPGGPGALVDFVLAADEERARLLAEAETAQDPHRIAEIQVRLEDIAAHAAPSRAAHILAGLGFDAEAQKRPLSEFSGGWRMRVALAAILFSEPDLLLLDEPTNYLDLEGTLWLIDYLRRYPAMVLIISHDRDLLDAVADHILYLDRCKLTLWRGNYSSFERQRREQLAVEQKHRKRQEEERQRIQAFVDRFRAKATKARQAQSRLKLLAKMEPLAALVESEVLPFDLPSPEKPLRPPIIAMQDVATGYGEDAIILRRLSLTIAEDDRIGLLGANGNGKSTFAKLLAGRLPALSGALRRSEKLKVGFFAQHQLDELDAGDTPYRIIARRMPDAPEAKIRARCARIGFPNIKADTRVELLSGGEKARLVMGLASFDGPHLLILDEPTNHLDIDSRTALIEAINDYAGAVILVSHDRHLLGACADRLWLVADGTVKNFDGDMEDYERFVLDKAAGPKKQETAKPTRPQPVERRASGAQRKRLAAVEERMMKFETLIARVDDALAQPDAFAKEPDKAAQLAKQRGELTRALEAAEEEWLLLSEASADQD